MTVAAEPTIREFTFTIDTAPGTVGGSVEFDRLCEVVYADERFLSPALGLEEDGAVSFVFNVEAGNLAEANELALVAVSESIAAHRAATHPLHELAKVVLVAAALVLIVKIAGELDVEVPAR